MKRLSNQKAARLFLMEMPTLDRIHIATSLLSEIVNPGMYAELRTHSHEIARHADRLERQLKLAAQRDGFCPPDTSGHLPRGGHKAAPRGLLTLLPGGALNDPG